MPIACGDRYILGSNRPRRLLQDLHMLFSSVGFIFGAVSSAILVPSPKRQIEIPE